MFGIHPYPDGVDKLQGISYRWCKNDICIYFKLGRFSTAFRRRRKNGMFGHKPQLNGSMSRNFFYWDWQKKSQ